MKKIVEKVDLDDCIRLLKEYDKTNDLDLLDDFDDLSIKLFGEQEPWIRDILWAIAKMNNHTTPLEIYCKILKLLGFEIKGE